MRRADAHHTVAFIEEQDKPTVTELVNKLGQRAQHLERHRPIKFLRDAERAHVFERDAFPAQPRAEQTFMFLVLFRDRLQVVINGVAE